MIINWRHQRKEEVANEVCCCSELSLAEQRERGMLDKLSPRLKMHEQTWPCLCALLMCVFMCDRARESPSGGRELRQPATTSPLLSLQAHNNPVSVYFCRASPLEILRGPSHPLSVAWIVSAADCQTIFGEKSLYTHTLSLSLSHTHTHTFNASWLLGGRDINYVGRL